MTGYYRMARGWMDHPIFAAEPLTEREAWLWLIEHAAYAPHVQRIGRWVVPVERGELAVSARHLAKVWVWDKSRISRFLKRLKTEAMIETVPTTVHTTITICNYVEYQSDNDSGETPIETRDETRARHERDTGETQYREEGKTKVESSDDVIGDIPKFLDRTKPKNGPKRATRLPKDWWPDEQNREFAESRGLDYRPIAEEFVDYWPAVPGQKGLKLDWDATFRNRCRFLAQRAAERERNRPGNAGLVSAARAVMAKGE